MERTKDGAQEMFTGVHGTGVTGFLSRIRIYFREMFPLPLRIANSTLLFVSFSVMLGVVCGLSTLFDWRLFMLGSANAFSIALILRLMDELKDLDVDRTLFVERPVPSGRVKESDIWICLSLVSAAFLVLNAVVGVAFWSALGLFVYCVLMFKYFFLPERFKSKLLVNLLTHNPVIPLLLLHFVFLTESWYSLGAGTLLGPHTALLVLMYWGLFLSWEVSRKIRYAHEETEYATYSRALGRKAAILSVGAVNKLCLGAGLWISLQHGLSLTYDVVLVAAFAIPLLAYSLFLSNKLTRGIQLRTAAELCALLVMLAPLLNLLIQGVTHHVSA